MIFSIPIIITLLLLLFSWILWKKTRPKYILSFLETSTPRLESFRRSEKTRNRYFPHESGIVDLSKHPELIRFKEVWGTKEYLVEPWERKGNLYVEEGKTKAVIFEFLSTGEGKENYIGIPCLRTIETIIEEDNDNPLLGYKETNLGVYWDEGRKIVSSENLLGIVKYESI